MLKHEIKNKNLLVKRFNPSVLFSLHLKLVGGVLLINVITNVNKANGTKMPLNLIGQKQTNEI